MVTAPRPPTSGYSFWVDVTVLEPDQRGGIALALITQVCRLGWKSGVLGIAMAWKLGSCKGPFHGLAGQVLFCGWKDGSLGWGGEAGDGGRC